MAQVTMVMVTGQPFAVCTTERNAVLLRDKINKTFEVPEGFKGDAVASIADSALLYNPKHLDVLEFLDSIGLTRVSEDKQGMVFEEGERPVLLTLPGQKPGARKSATSRR